MAWRFRKIPIVSGEVIHPDCWIQNHMEYVNEYNGMLDRDNIPSNLDWRLGTSYSEPYTTKNIQKACFHEIYSYNSEDWFRFRNGFSGWATRQDDIASDPDRVDRVLGVVNFVAPTEGMIIAHWTGWLVGFPFEGPVNLHEDLGSRGGQDGFANEDFHNRSAITANFRILVNGTEVSNSGKHSAAWPNQCVSMTGAAPVEAGNVKVIVQGRAGVFIDLEFEMRAYTSDTTIFILRNRELVVIYKKR